MGGFGLVLAHFGIKAVALGSSVVTLGSTCRACSHLYFQPDPMHRFDYLGVGGAGGGFDLVIFVFHRRAHARTVDGRLAAGRHGGAGDRAGLGHAARLRPARDLDEIKTMREIFAASAARQDFAHDVPVSGGFAALALKARARIWPSPRSARGGSSS